MPCPYPGRKFCPESPHRRASRHRARVRPQLEELESRATPATFNVATGPELEAAILQANSNADSSNTINLAPGTFHLSGELVMQNKTWTILVSLLTKLDRNS